MIFLFSTMKQKMINCIRENTRFSHATEILESIITGLEPCKDDNIIAVCGSGDAAFALLEYADKVTAVDISKNQIRFARTLKQILKSGDTDQFIRRGLPEEQTYPEMIGTFVSHTSTSKVSRYFREPGRLEKIRAKLDNLSFTYVTDFIDALPTDKYGNTFNKAYLSNIMSYYASSTAHNSKARTTRPYDYITSIIEQLKPADRIYIANYCEGFNEKFPECSIRNLPKNLMIDQRLSKAAEEKEFLFSPLVICKQP